jgi:3-keto-disaccharide hydrolase
MCTAVNAFFFLVCFALAGTALAAGKRENFDASPAMPAGWQTGITGKGEAKWEVVADSSAPSSPNVLKQSGEATFNWAAKTDEKIKDGFVEVKIKPVSGKEDQAGGIVWRFQDANNYYVVRANALEGNVVLYKTVNGKRSSLQVKGRMFGYGVDTKVPGGKWNTLRVEFTDKFFTVFFNGKQLFQVEDETFRDAGAVGLWTKADSVTVFDDFTFGTK